MLLHASWKCKENFSLPYKAIRTEYPMCKNKTTKLTSKAWSKVELNTRFNLQSNSAGGLLDASSQCLPPEKKPETHLTSKYSSHWHTLLSSELSEGEDVMSWNWSLSLYVGTDTDTPYHKGIDKFIPFMLENNILACKKKLKLMQHHYIFRIYRVFMNILKRLHDLWQNLVPLPWQHQRYSTKTTRVMQK